MAWQEFHIFPVETNQTEILSSLLFESGAEGVEETDNGLKAYFDGSNLDLPLLEKELKAWPLLKNCQLESKEMPNTNWNEEWEKQYEPVIIENKIKVRASFHQADAEMDYDILIDPKMSFGTAHHATTYMMMQAMLEIDFEGKSVLDFGCGTAILAILAEKMGAKKVFAIDNDEWAFENGKENIGKNHCQNIEIQLGDAQNLTADRYDIILANVNRNAILENSEILNAQLKNSAYLLLSGLLENDEALILEKFKALGCEKLKTIKRDNWIAILMQSNK